MNEAVRRVRRPPGVYRTMRQFGRREIHDRRGRLVLAVTLAAHVGAAISVQWPALARVCGSAVGVGCLVAAYLASPTYSPCRAGRSGREELQ